MQKNFTVGQPSPRILLPLRLFLSITFIYAGIQKLTDPQFFQPEASGYIGKQLIAYAHTSPMRDFLLQVAAPHALLFGLLVAYGEIAIGLGTLVGFLMRPAAFFGVILSILFFLSISWKVYPYFYGSDIVFAFSWLTLFLNGPRNTGLFTADEHLSSYLQQLSSLQGQHTFTPLLYVLLGTSPRTEPAPTLNQTNATSPYPRARQVNQRTVIGRASESRRSFILGALLGGAGTLGLVAATFAWRLLSSQSQASTNIPDAPPTPLPSNTTSPTSTSSSGVAQTVLAAGNGSTIAQASAVQKNSALTFTIAQNGDPGVLIHLNSGQFVAYDATCTHAGCQVDYDPSSQHLVCPCHGAEFDPAQQGAAIHPPADTPLTALALHIDGATGTITLKQ